MQQLCYSVAVLLSVKSGFNFNIFDLIEVCLDFNQDLPSIISSLALLDFSILYMPGSHATSGFTPNTACLVDSSIVNPNASQVS